MLDLLRHCISIDVETTGLDPEKHALIEFGACSFDCEGSLFVEFPIPPTAEISPYALEVNGHSEEELRSREAGTKYWSMESGLSALENYASIDDQWVIVGKNPRFDWAMLKANWERTFTKERRFPFTYRVINWADMAIPLMLKDGIKVPHTGFSSTDICNFLGIKPEPTPHNGLTGAKYNKMCVKAILGRYDDLIL